MIKEKNLDCIFLVANSASKTYQSLSKTYSAIEPPTWALLLAQSTRSVGFDVDILDRMLDSVLPTFLNKTGEFSKGTDEESIIDTAAETVDLFRTKIANFDFKQANVEVERYHYDKDQGAYRYIFCGECEDGTPRRIREADPVKGIKAEYAKGYGWDHNGFRIEAYSPRDLGSMANLYDNMAAFNVVTLVGPHTNSSQDSARIATIHIQ